MITCIDNCLKTTNMPQILDFEYESFHPDSENSDLCSMSKNQVLTLLSQFRVLHMNGIKPYAYCFLVVVLCVCVCGRGVKLQAYSCISWLELNGWWVINDTVLHPKQTSYMWKLTVQNELSSEQGMIDRITFAWQFYLFSHSPLFISPPFFKSLLHFFLWYKIWSKIKGFYIKETSWNNHSFQNVQKVVEVDQSQLKITRTA